MFSISEETVANQGHMRLVTVEACLDAFIRAGYGGKPGEGCFGWFCLDPTSEKRVSRALDMAI